MTSDSETGVRVPRILRSSSTLRGSSSHEEPTPIHPDVGGYLAVMTGINLHYAMHRGGDARSERSSSDGSELVAITQTRLDPITRNYIRDMTGATLRSMSEADWSSSASPDPAGVDGRNPYFRYSTSPSSRSTTPGLSDDRGSRASSIQAQSPRNFSVDDFVDATDPHSELRLQLAEERQFEIPASSPSLSPRARSENPSELNFRVYEDTDSQHSSSDASRSQSSSEESFDRFASRYQHDSSSPTPAGRNQLGRQSADFEIYQDRGNDHLHASPAAPDSSSERGSDAFGSEAIWSSIERDFSSEPPSPFSDERLEVDDRTYRFLSDMTGMEVREIRDLWRDGTPPLDRAPDRDVTPSSDGGSDKENRDPDPSRASTPAGHARIDPVTQEFVRQMTGREVEFVSLSRERRDRSPSHEQSLPGTPSSAESDRRSEGSRGGLHRTSTVSPSPLSPNENAPAGNRKRARSDSSEPERPKRLRQDGPSSDVSRSQTPDDRSAGEVNGNRKRARSDSETEAGSSKRSRREETKPEASRSQPPREASPAILPSIEGASPPQSPRNQLRQQERERSPQGRS